MAENVRRCPKKTAGPLARVFQTSPSMRSSTFIPSLREVRLFVAQCRLRRSETNTDVKGRISGDVGRGFIRKHGSKEVCRSVRAVRSPGSRTVVK